MRSGSTGFTLLEVMVVLLLIALIAGIVIPKFNGIFQVELKSSLRKLAGSIKFAFNEAIIKQSTIRINFDLLTNTYRYEVLVTDGSSTIGEFMEMPSDIAEPVELPAGIFFMDILTPRNIRKIEEGNTSIMFYPTGYAEKAVIHMADRTGNQYTLLVRPLTGNVKIFEGYMDFAEFNQTETPFGTSTSLGQ